MDRFPPAQVCKSKLNGGRLLQCLIKNQQKRQVSVSFISCLFFLKLFIGFGCKMQKLLNTSFGHFIENVR